MGARMNLCRCGQSANKPRCDGTHATIALRDDFWRAD
jgi:CDGSH-type Zn-finger protein